MQNQDYKHRIYINKITTLFEWFFFHATGKGALYHFTLQGRTSNFQIAHCCIFIVSYFGFFAFNQSIEQQFVESVILSFIVAMGR